MYTALVLDAASVAALAAAFNTPEGWEELCHHMTLHMGGHKSGKDPELGEGFELTVVGVGENPHGNCRAVAVVTDCPSKNAQKHVTLCVNRAQGGKPFFSNKIEKWETTAPIVLHGTVQECA